MVTTTITVVIQFVEVKVPFDKVTGLVGLGNLTEVRATGTENAVKKLLSIVSKWRNYHDFRVEFVHVTREQDIKLEREAAIIAMRDVIDW